MDTSKTPSSKRKTKASLGTAIKRSVQATRKGPGSAAKKRRVVVATQTNIARALNNEKLDSNDSKIGSPTYEGRITRARNATLNATLKETPSRMLRQLSKVLPKPSPERQTPRRNSVRVGIQRTPGSVRPTPNSTRRSTNKPNNKCKDSVSMKKQSPQDLLRQLTRAPGFIQDVPIRIEVSNFDSDEIESKKELLENMEQHVQNNIQIQQSTKDDELMDIETQLHDKIDYSEDEISNCLDQITETMEFTGEVITDRKDIGIEFNNQVEIQPPKDQEFVSNIDNNEAVDAFNSPIAGSSRLQEGNELDNFWLGRNLNDLNNFTFENNFEINENSERRNRLLNELLRSSLDNQAENGLENYLSHDSLENQSNERVQLLFNPKKYDIENIVSLDPLVNETENEHSIQPEDNSGYDIHVPIINNDTNDLENESTVEVTLDDKSPENDMIVIQNESEKVEEIFEFDNDHVNLEQRLNNNNKRNERMRTNKFTGITRLPNSLIKSLFSKFSSIKVSKEAMQMAFDGTQEYLEQISNDLNTYASHAKREVIQEKDVLLLMKRQGLITEKSTFESLVEQYLPRELSNEICPYARSGNIVYPQKQFSRKGTKKSK
ncbi:hypothetical protein RhiirA5_365966 [Rhizophagus irregularis]|uniref:CENP-T/Histone H4 histone fold domain-containing protein n=5 Tax=Rhizophagus irregularis TaxID=588596 RepID=A0A2I1F5U0_9GLOM|nr:hypothetical protein RirG_256130 [Rhizophagus irregularis DAOM 197198w]PKC00015.1 hypothetical protein RhiirA5_365966 [Rhizophagus irregularis]PKY29733.1 hypothetical protein RhiirB3_418227 [Rhizophagus irregularis]UZO29294.1 hypothetical protein OCT59_022774 [Rhizophagus irregularis]CAB4483959.1 unnamed protein product [Rhizophagus irregularis]